MSTRSVLAREIACDVLEELRGRKGYGAFWDHLDANVREEIVISLGHIIDKRLKRTAK